MAYVQTGDTKIWTDLMMPLIAFLHSQPLKHVPSLECNCNLMHCCYQQQQQLACLSISLLAHNAPAMTVAASALLLEEVVPCCSCPRPHAADSPGRRLMPEGIAEMTQRTFPQRTSSLQSGAHERTGGQEQERGRHEGALSQQAWMAGFHACRAKVGVGQSDRLSVVPDESLEMISWLAGLTPCCSYTLSHKAVTAATHTKGSMWRESQPSRGLRPESNGYLQ